LVQAGPIDAFRQSEKVKILFQIQQIAVADLHEERQRNRQRAARASLLRWWQFKNEMAWA
jgi:hypothetical protein